MHVAWKRALARQQEAVIGSSFTGPVDAFRTTLPGGWLTMDNHMFVVAVWHRLCIRVPSHMPSVPCRCRASVTVGAEHMVCKNAAKLTRAQTRHDILDESLWIPI